MMIRFYKQVLYHLHYFMFKLAKHIHWLYALVLLTLMLILLNYHFGTIKAIGSWSWLDIIGEGTSALFISIWFTLMLASRHAGRTTTLLGSGFLMIYLAHVQDFLDEFIEIPQQVFPWDSLIESLPIGFSLLTLAMIYLYQEQQLIHTYLGQHRSTFEDNQHIDRETGLAPINIMLDNIQQAITHSSKAVQFTLLHIEVTEPNQRISEQAKFKRYCADALVSNLPEHAKVYYLAKNHYAIISILAIKQHQTLIVPLIQTLRTLRYYHKTITCSLRISSKDHSLSHVNSMKQIESLVMDSVKAQKTVYSAIT